MRHTTNASAVRLVGAVIGALLLVVVLGAPQALAAAPSESQAAQPAAGLLARGAGYDQPNGSPRVRTLQLRLRSTGEATGPIDGRFGPLTEAAVRRFQVREGLAVDGLVGPDTQNALRRAAAQLRLGAGYADSHGSARVRKLQRGLRAAGEHPGPIDGRFGPLTEAAVRHFQARERLAADGIVGTSTRAMLQRRLSSVRHESKAAEKVKPRATSQARQPQTGPTNDSPSGTSGFEAAEWPLVALALGLLAVSALALTRRARRRELPAANGAAPAGIKTFAPAKRGTTPGAKEGGEPDLVPVVGYACVDSEPDNGLDGDLRGQAETIALECERRGLALLELVREREPRRGSALARPGLEYALHQISAGGAQGLVVAELSRLGHSVPDLGRVLEWFSRSRTRLVAAAEGLDTQDRDGRVAVNTLIHVSRRERERLVARTRKGMRAAHRKGPPGVADYPELRDRIARMRADGMTLQAIADRLNAEGVPTVRGGAKWRPSSVQAAAGYRRPRAGVKPEGDRDANGNVQGI